MRGYPTSALWIQSPLTMVHCGYTGVVHLARQMRALSVQHYCSLSCSFILPECTCSDISTQFSVINFAKGNLNLD